MKVFVLGLILACFACAAAPRVIFTKSFPESMPAYESVSIDRTGALQYKESPTDDQPVTAQLSQAEVAPIFQKAERLGYFQSPLESGLKVAKTGKKTFSYVDADGKVTQSSFNYSTDETARQLLDKFEQIASTERAYLELDRTIHFDKLGVNQALAQVESLWLQKQLAAPQQFLPLFNRIIEHPSYMHLVRDRAAKLKEKFQAPTPVANAEAK